MTVTTGKTDWTVSVLFCFHVKIQVLIFTILTAFTHSLQNPFFFFFWFCFSFFVLWNTVWECTTAFRIFLLIVAICLHEVDDRKHWHWISEMYLFARSMFKCRLIAVNMYFPVGGRGTPEDPSLLRYSACTLLFIASATVVLVIPAVLPCERLEFLTFMPEWNILPLIY